MGNYLSSFCCRDIKGDEGEPTFTNDDNVIPEAKRASDQENNGESQHDGAPLLKATTTNIDIQSESSDGSYDAELMNKMLKEVEDDLSD